MFALESQDWWSDEAESARQKIELMSDTDLQELASHINERNRAAQLAQRASQALFQALFFRGRAPDDPRCVVDAVIFAARDNGVLVYVPRYALKGPVHLRQKDGQVLWYRKGVGPVWLDGTVKQDVNQVTVESQGKKQVSSGTASEFRKLYT